MATTDGEPDIQPQVLFRPGKKRNAYRRQRADESESTANESSEIATDAVPTAAISTPVAHAAQDDDDEEGLSVAEVIRLRNARRHKLAGVGFRAGPSPFGDDRPAAEDNTEQGLVLHEGAEGQPGAEKAIIGGISKRFAPQTGLVGELVNKHM